MYYNEKSIVFVDGEFLLANAVNSSAYSQTLHYGGGVFEGIRSYEIDGKAAIFKAREHFERLLYSANALGFKVNYTIDQLTELSSELLQRNNLTSAYIRPIFIAADNMSLAPTPSCKLIIQCWHWDKYMGNDAVRVMASSFQRPNPKSCIIDAKVCGYYTNSILSTKEAKENGYDEALLADIDGNIAECSAANFFMEKDGKLITPPVGHILPGITRATIIGLCKRENISIEEKSFTLEDVLQADSAFFTGTAAEVAPIKSINDYQFPSKWENAIGAKLQRLYLELVHTKPLIVA